MRRRQEAGGTPLVNKAATADLFDTLPQQTFLVLKDGEQRRRHLDENALADAVPSIRLLTAGMAGCTLWNGLIQYAACSMDLTGRRISVAASFRVTVSLEEPE
ncbi:MAG: hypothetical protein OXC19_07065 [Bryobacterales bacterium]|nr:hypothetical protein [Bryobacterales bacterium]